jgi:cytochrome c biogenesis protein CcdA
MNRKVKNSIMVIIAATILILFYFLARNVSADYLKNLGLILPLPIFTFLIALVDGFNPCNLFVLTFLLALLISVSHSRKRIFTVGYIFVTVVYLIYFLFMAAWLNVFQFIGFIDPLRITIAIIALAAGIINCKELFFFRKGITLMVQEAQKPFLMRKIDNMKEVIKKASMPGLVAASIGLAAFSSLVELPCTAGFPIIYTAILSGRILDHTLGYYLYLLFYNLIYILPLAIIITIFGFSFKAKKITPRQMGIIKFIGGAIMIVLGIILLVNPHLLMIG